MSEKIQKVLANAGVGSRRQIEGWISESRITVNGRTAVIGDRMSYSDKVSVDGREVKLLRSKTKKTRVLLYHKPEGEMCTRNDPEGRPTIFESLPIIRNNRWICVGRLDFNTSGLLLITNDGDLAHKLMHPSSCIEREYAVRIRGDVSAEHIQIMQKGVELEDGSARFLQISDGGGTGSNHWFHVVVKEGRNRLVRRIWESLGYTVSRLIRIRFGNVYLPSGLKRGRHIELDEEDIDSLTLFLNQLEMQKQASG
jgi:23S rRNA pseudouridine2605 synthase